MMKVDIKIIEKVLEDKATPEEAKMVVEWFSEEEGNEFLSRYITDELEGLTEEKVMGWLDHGVPERRMKARFLNQLRKSKKKKFQRRLLMAAVVFPFLFLSVAVTFLAGRAGIFSETQYVEVSVPCGERMQVVLQDGSVVVLNSNSKLRYPQKFGLFVRTVELSGEGYFEVAKMRTAPFVVDLKELKVEVTGTKFNVKSYEDDDKIWVTLEEGGVRLKNGGKLEYSLVPGDYIEYNRLSGKCRLERQKNFEEISAWRHNSLNFYLTPLRDILKVLERQYDTHFVAKDSLLLNSRFTLSTAKVYVADVLKDLETVSHIVFRRIGDDAYQVMRAER